ncbi:MAG: hypothetical protein JWM95_5533 [Gemmatimonadetes bacterium]|nr:hypothetical protein [Gemmatimonadota bacterium]
MRSTINTTFRTLVATFTAIALAIASTPSTASAAGPRDQFAVQAAAECGGFGFLYRYAISYYSDGSARLSHVWCGDGAWGAWDTAM